MLTAVGRVHQLFPMLAVLRPATLTGLLAIILFWIDRHDARRLDHLYVAPAKYLVALLFWMMLSVTGALVPGASLQLAFDFLKTVLMFFVVAGSVRSAHDVERLTTVYLGAATVYAAVVLSRFDVGAGDAWRLGRLYYYDANDFATLVVTAMPFGLFLLHAGRSWHARAAGALSLAVLTLAFVRTGSRGGFVALIVVGTFLVWRYTAIPFRWRVSAAALVTVLVLAAASDQYWKQMNTIFSDVDYNRTEESGRMQIWRRGVGYMLRDPVFGVGPGNFPAAEGKLSPFANRQEFGIGVRWNAAHNSFVQAGAELGVPGLVMFVGLIGTTMGLLRRVARSNFDPVRSYRIKALTQALMASVIGFVVGAFFLSLAYTEMLYMLAALAVGLYKATGEER